MSLSEQLDQSYAEHPAFQFGYSWKDPDQRDLDDFSNAYSKLQNLRGRLNPREWNAYFNECLESMSRIFTSLRNQAVEDDEKWFIDELESNCQHLLRREVDHYRSQRNVKIPHRRNKKFSSQIAAMLSERHFFGQLPEQVVDDILDIGKTFLATFRDNASQGNLTREDLSFNSGDAAREISAILNKAFKSLGVLDAVSAYMGHRMRVGGQAFEYSVPQAKWWHNTFEDLPRPPHTVYAHLDESIVMPKSIVYLNNVGHENGPTGCSPKIYEEMDLHPLQEIVGRIVCSVGGSTDSPLHDFYNGSYHQHMASENFRRHFMKLPSSIRFNSHLGWDIAPGSNAERVLSSREKKMIGPRGTFVVFDGGRLLHRGGMLQSGERIALQVVFSRRFSFLEKLERKYRKIN